MGKNEDNKLKNLEALENSAKLIETPESSDAYLYTENKNSDKSIVDGYKILEREDMPQGGILYPESWNFAYRCPTSKEVANFSTITEGDQPSIVAAVEDLIRKCVVILNSDNGQQVSSGQINDAHRIFFLLLLRDFYLPGSPMLIETVCSMHKGQINIPLNAQTLIYPELSGKLLEAFDGRKFSLKMPNVEENIEFLIPTIEITARIFRFIVKIYRDSQKDKENKDDKIAYDKNFLLIAPYLYIRGNETVKEIIQKFKKIQEDDNKFKAYLEIVSKIKLDNLDYIETTCPECDSLEENQIRFPGGWKKFFIGNDTTGYFN